MTSSDTVAIAENTRYSAPAIWLHWLLAVLVVGMIGLGWYMTSIEDDPGSDWYFNLHKSIGIVVGLLVLLRLAWRLGHKPAALPASIPRWEAKSARIVHWLLYACLLLMPVLGLTGALFSKAGVVFFGLEIPRFLGPSRFFTEVFLSAHVAVSWLLVGLICIHVLAAAKHLLIDKDGVFQRMWF